MENINNLYKPNTILYKLPYELEILEKTKNETTNQSNEYDFLEEIPFIYTTDYLYHGIRFQKYLEKLEDIFKTKKILAGKFIPNYYSYSDNCNKGEFVSLFKWINHNHIEYETFIESNISLLVTPAVNAIITKYISYTNWLEINKEDLQLKNYYSYMQGECFVKDYIPLDYIKAIGVPYQKLLSERKLEYANKLIEDIQILMEQYNQSLPIVDTSRYNHLLIDTNQKKPKN